MEVIECTNNRYEAHRDVERRFRNGSVERNYQWRFVGTRAIVRTEVEVDTSELGGMEVEFSIDAVPMRKVGAKDGRKAKRTFLYSDKEREAWITTRLYAAGLMVTDVESVSLDSHIQKGPETFPKQGVRFSGSAIVHNSRLLHNALASGIGDGKAYGYGMLIVN